MAEGTGTSGKDPELDLIELDSGIVPIPAHVELVPTPEEIREARILRALKIAAGTALLAAVAFSAHGFIRHRSRAEAIAEARRDGREEAFDAAISLTDEEALLGWLTGAAALTRGASDVGLAEIEAMHAGAEGDSDAAKLARAYVAFFEGDLRGAREAAEALELDGELSSEGIFLRSIVAEAHGQHEASANEASVAHRLDPESSRYLARWATALVLSGRPEEALSHLSGADPDLPNIALARARAELAKGADPKPAIASARRVLESSDATTAERGWAELVLARAHLAAGDEEQATEAIERARAQVPAADELFRIRAAEVLLSLGLDSEAEAALGPKDPPVSTEPGLRGLLRGRIALARDDVAGAKAALEKMPSVPERALLEGGLAEARGALDRAAEAYRRAAETPTLRALALSLVVPVEVGLGQPEAAVRSAEALLAMRANHPRHVAVAVDAFAAMKDFGRARSVLEKAEQAHHGDLRLEVARGRLHLAAGEIDRALAALSSAAERAPNESSVHADLGDAARRAGDADRARAAYARAIELRPGSPKALLGLVELALDRWDLDEARAKLSSIDALGRKADGPRLWHLRARYLVASGAGAMGTEALSAHVRSRRGDGFLRVAMGELALQAERHGQAAAYFNAAAGLEGVDAREALARVALSYALARRGGAADRALERAREHDAERRPASRSERTAAALARIEALELVAQGRVELLDDRPAAARRSLARALRKEPTLGHALLLEADLAIAAESPTAEQLRRAWLGRPRQPRAAGRLAVMLGATEEGCAAGRAYLEAAPNGEHAHEVRAVVGQCPAERRR